MLLTLGFGVAGIALAIIAMPADVRGKPHPGLIAAAAILSLATAALCGHVGGETAEAAFAAAVIPLFFAISAVDLATRRIPNRALVVGTATVLSAALPNGSWVVRAHIGIAIGGSTTHVGCRLLQGEEVLSQSGTQGEVLGIIPSLGGIDPDADHRQPYYRGGDSHAAAPARTPAPTSGGCVPCVTSAPLLTGPASDAVDFCLR